MTKAEIAKVVDQMTPACWGKYNAEKAVERLTPDNETRYRFFQYGFMFDSFWYKNEAVDARKKHIQKETARIAKALLK